MGVSCQLRASFALSTGRANSTIWRGGWLGLRAGADVLENRDLLPQPGVDYISSVVQRVAQLQYLLSCPGTVTDDVYVQENLTEVHSPPWVRRPDRLPSEWSFFRYKMAAEYRIFIKRLYGVLLRSRGTVTFRCDIPVVFYKLTYLLTYLLHGAESFLRS